MRIDVLLALTSLTLAGVAQQRGAVASVSAVTGTAGAPTIFRVTGNNPCTTVRVDFGDGTNQVHSIQGLPAQIRHNYARPGTYQVRARGTGTCTGLAVMTVRVDTAGAGRSRGSLPARFSGMDRNGDGRISQAEWRGSAQSFRVHDWNGDGVLSGDEVRAGASRPRTDDPDYTPDRTWLDDWSERRFQRLDIDGDNRLTRQEWPFDYEAFVRADRNQDSMLSREEFLGSPDVDDDRLDQFDYLDLNGNNRLERSEWHASPDVFTWLDRDGNGWLSRAEMAGERAQPRDPFSSLDLDNDSTISVNEWQWSRTSFDRLDRNRDGRLTRDEFDATSPMGSTGTSAPIAVRPTDRWTDTGIYVRAGDVLTFNATGTIEMSGESGDPADPTGSRTGRLAPSAPLPNEPAGILLARIGTGTPVAVGRTNRIRASLDGRLYLGVNDDYLGDNHGQYRVTVTVSR
jgi:Ca2+-binding EF-hand superfamily protein